MDDREQLNLLFVLILLFVWRRLRSRQRRMRGRRRIFRYALFNRIQLRRLQQISLLPAIALFAAQWMEDQDNNQNFGRRFWSIPRPQLWFETLLANDDMEFYWRRHFRMRKQTFLKIVQLVGPEIRKQDTFLRAAVPVEKRIGIALWRLATGDTYRAIGTTFGQGKSTAIMITREFCKAISNLAGRCIKFPSQRGEVERAIREFADLEFCAIPQAVGAIDGTHFEILAPDKNAFDYFDRKQRYSVAMQAVVGSDLKLLDVAIGYPGSMHDSRILRCSSLYRRAENRIILNEPLKNINGIQVRPLLLGDGAYPLSSWLVKPYPQLGRLTASEARYNRKLSSARTVVERAFGLLKARWRCLLKRLDNKFRNVPTIILACCILHNICQNEGDDIDDENFLQQIIRGQREQAARAQIRQDAANITGRNLRETIREYLDQ